MIKTTIVGMGLSGEVLLKILLGHPRVGHIELVSEHIQKANAQRILESFKKSGSGAKSLSLGTAEDAAVMGSGDEIVFFCKPNGFSMREIPKYLAAEKKVIDIAGDFRLKSTKDFKQWYGMPHARPKFLKKAVYGLCEMNREKIRRAHLVANPGCYPTGILLALAPLLKQKLVDVSSLIADSYSGISGAGKSPNEKNLFLNAYGNIKAYSVAGAHRHVPEIEQEASVLCGKKVSLCFTPHLAPLDHGIFTTLYLTPKKKMTEANLGALYEEMYANEPFVKIVSVDECDLHSVQHTNDCLIAPTIDKRTGKFIVLSAIDNLVKGAAGQAVQNMNLMLGFQETTGLV